MTTKVHGMTQGSDIPAARLIETARWHILRYDSLRASLASRASFVLSADAVLIAGISFLFSWTAKRGIYGGIISLALVGVGMLLALTFALLSVRRASRALLSNKSWRTLFSSDAPPSLFYQHSDTIKAIPTYAEFSTAFKGQATGSELESAIVNLWLVLHTHAYRYRFLREATNQLQIAISAFAGSAIAAVILGLFG
jgi:hypothetical protein